MKDFKLDRKLAVETREENYRDWLDYTTSRGIALTKPGSRRLRKSRSHEKLCESIPFAGIDRERFHQQYYPEEVAAFNKRYPMPE